jgi:hypothetical protein
MLLGLFHFHHLHNVEGYKTFLEKKSPDHTVEDKGELKNKYPKHWALMADKGYQGAVEDKPWMDDKSF